MATFRFVNRDIDIHWNGYDITGPAGTVFSIPDQLYEEFEGDLRPVEPSLEWIDTNEFQTLENQVSTANLSATFPVAIATSTSGKTISLSSSTNPNGYLLTADGSGGVIFTPASTSGLTSVVGISPISTIITGGTVSVSLTANYQTAGSYQPAGTYVNAVIGTSPASVVTASGTSTVSIDQAAITGATAATNAQVVRFLVKNTTGTTIPKGSAVYVSGATGDNALISLASATADPTSSKTLGLTLTDIATDDFGYVVESGYITDIDTSSTTAGAAVWLGNTPGSLVFASPPTEPSHAVYLGVVVRVQSQNGSILVKVQNGYELDELHDVFVGGVSTALPLVYNSTSSGWIAQALSSVGIADNAIVASKIAAGAVGSAAIASNAVVLGGIAPGAVNSSALADNAVVAAKIAAASVGTAALSSGAAANGTVLTANGSGGVTFASANAAGGYYVTGTSLVDGANLTSMPTGGYLVENLSATSIEVIRSSGTTSTVAQYQRVYSSQRTSTDARFPIMSAWETVSINSSTVETANSRYLNGEWWIFGTIDTTLSAGLHRSTDSISWTTVTSGLANNERIYDMGYNGSNQYVLVGSSQANVGKISTSPGTSGSTWTARTISANMRTCRGVASSGSRWVVVGGGNGTGESLTSTDGITWTSTQVDAANAINDVAFGASIFVAVGLNGKIYTSPSTSGTTWTERTSGVATSIGSVTYENAIFAACTASSVLSSTDGITWTVASSGIALASLVYANFTHNGPMWVGTNGSNRWAISRNTPPSSFSNGTAGNNSMGGRISYNSNTIITPLRFSRFSRATETTSFNSVWTPVTEVTG